MFSDLEKSLELDIFLNMSYIYYSRTYAKNSVCAIIMTLLYLTHTHTYWYNKNNIITYNMMVMVVIWRITIDGIVPCEHFSIQ